MHERESAVALRARLRAHRGKRWTTKRATNEARIRRGEDRAGPLKHVKSSCTGSSRDVNPVVDASLRGSNTLRRFKVARWFPDVVFADRTSGDIFRGSGTI